MRFVEIAKDHKKLYLYNEKGLQAAYTVLFNTVNPKLNRQYIVFADLENKDPLGICKINAAAVKFDIMTGSLRQFDEKLQPEEWKFLNHEVKQYLETHAKKEAEA